MKDRIVNLFLAKIRCAGSLQSLDEIGFDPARAVLASLGAMPWSDQARLAKRKG